MPSFVDSVRQKADQAALEADKLIRIRREQGAIDQLRRDIKAQLDALGQATVAAYCAGEIAHPQLVNICQQMDALTEQIGQREARIEQTRAERLVTPSAPQTGVPCPSCRQLIPAGTAFCAACGYKIPKAAPAEVICPACGSPMPAAAQFCPNCGGRKAPEPQTIRCTGCGAELPATAVFCPDCGTRVGAVAPATPASSVAPPPVEVMPAPAVAVPVIAEPVISEAPEPAYEPEVTLSLDEPAEVEAPVTTEATPAPLTKPCFSCQAVLPIEAIFCPDCGARQQAP